MFFIVLLYFCLSVAGLLYLYRLKKEWKFKQFPGPKRLPVFGSMFEAFGDPEHLWNTMRTLNTNHGPFYRLVMPHFITVCVLKPEDLEVVFTNTKSQKKGSVYDLLHEWMGTGLLTSFGEKWKRRRKILTPGFHFNVLNKYAETFFHETEKMIEKMKKEKGDGIKNIDEWSSDHTLRIICETAMGCSSEIFDTQEGKDYKAAVHFYGYTVSYRTLRPWFIFLKPLYFLSNVCWKQMKSVKILHNFSTKIIDERLRDADSRNTADLIAEHEKKKTQSMLDILIEAYKRGEIDRTGIREEVDTFVFEGYDTTAMALSYSLLCLAEFGDVQNRARDEVDKMWKECGGKITVAEIQKLAYLDRAIKETLRLYPSVPFIMREVIDDIKIKSYTIPKGSQINIHLYDIHRNREVWPDPLKYDPDRFLPENNAKRHAFAYVPFSGGPRNCIGQKFAMIELKTILAYVLHNFTLQPISTTKDVIPISDLVLRYKNPLFVKFVKR